MADITTDFAGTENAATVYSRLESMIDYYYGTGYFDTLTTRASIRSAINDLQSSANDFLADSELASSFITKLNRFNDPDNLRTELDTLTGANKAAFWDLSTASTVYETTGTSDPCEAGDPISTLTGRAIGTLATASWTSTTTQRPLWQTTYADFDATNDQMAGDANLLTMCQNASSCVLGASFRLSSLSTNRSLLTWREGVTNFTPRVTLEIISDGSIIMSIRRTDGDTTTARLSAAGLITTGVDYCVIGTVDFATGGAGAVKAYINNGSDVINGTLTGSGNTSNTASIAAGFGIGVGGGTPMSGRIYRAFAGAFIPTTAERALLNGVLRGGL